MRTLSLALLSLVLVTTPSCEMLGSSMPTTLAGVAEAASKLSTDMGGFLNGLDMGNLMTDALKPVSGFVDTGKSLMSGLQGLPAEATSGVDLSGFQDALGGIANFDVDGLMSAMGGEQSSMLAGLKDAAMNLGTQASALLGG